MKPLVIAATIFGACVFVLLAWLGHVFQPFMKAGSCIQLQDRHFGSYEFQVWQRKNPNLLEPFTTALFVRNKANRQWLAFSLGHQNAYSPAISLRPTNSQIAVYHGNSYLAGTMQ
ncbi:MAG: hypothetical protein U1F83_00130 [Verrucomicrobiota bacterium]